MTVSRASLSVLLVAACSLGCSGHGTGNGSGPDNPGNGDGPEMPTDALARIAPQESRCTVGPGWVEIDIAMPVTFVNGDYRWTEAYRWTLDCWPEACEGTALYIPRGSESIQTFALVGARITSIHGFVGTVQWRDSVFVVDVNYGRVTYTGPARRGFPGSGEAKCDDYGTITPAIPKKKKNTNEIRS